MTLWDYREGFESTAHPAELLWGPGPMAEALEAWLQEGSRWDDDSTAVLDRAFFVRYPPGSDEPAPRAAGRQRSSCPRASGPGGGWSWSPTTHGRRSATVGTRPTAAS